MTESQSLAQHTAASRTVENDANVRRSCVERTSVGGTMVDFELCGNAGCNPRGCRAASQCLLPAADTLHFNKVYRGINDPDELKLVVSIRASPGSYRAIGYVGQLPHSTSWYAWKGDDDHTVAGSVGKSKTYLGAAWMLSRYDK